MQISVKSPSSEKGKMEYLENSKGCNWVDFEDGVLLKYYVSWGCRVGQMQTKRETDRD